MKKRYIIIPLVIIGLILIYFAYGKQLPQVLEIFKSNHSEELIENYLSMLPIEVGLICLGLLQMAQVITIVFPGAAIKMAGGMIYGAVPSFLVCHTFFVGTNVGLFYLARKQIIPTEKLFENKKGATKVSEWINSSSPAFMSMLAYMMQGLPNGFVPYIAAKTDITLLRFGISVYLGSLPQIFLMCIIGHKLLKGDYFASIIMVVATLIVIVLLYIFRFKIINFVRNHRNIFRF